MGLFSFLTEGKEIINYRRSISKRYNDLMSSNDTDEVILDVFVNTMKIMLKPTYNNFKTLSKENLENILDAEISPFFVIAEREPKKAVDVFIEYLVFKGYGKDYGVNVNLIKKTINFGIQNADENMLFTMTYPGVHSMGWIFLLDEKSKNILNIK